MQPLNILTRETALHGPSEPFSATLRFLGERVRDLILGGLRSKMVTLNHLTVPQFWSWKHHWGK